jgi:hypothetical protein
VNDRLELDQDAVSHQKVLSVMNDQAQKTLAVLVGLVNKLIDTLK